MTQVYKYILIYLCFLLTLKLYAVPDFFRNRSFIFINEENGLPHNYINDIFKDSDGYIWMATHKGISRYDGYQFMTFDTHSNPVSLKSNYVNCFAEDKFGRLWVATEEGLTILSQNRAEEVNPSAGNDKIKTLFNSYVQTVYSDKNGNMWVAAANNLWCLKFNELGRVSEYYSLPFATQSEVFGIIDYGNGVCAGLDNMVYEIVPGKNRRLSIKRLSENIVSFSDDWRILCICRDGDLLWIGTNRGLFKYNIKLDTVKRYRYSNHRPNMLSQAYITDVVVSDDGHLLVSTLNGLNVYNRESDSFSFIRQDYRNHSSSISCNRINTLFCDKGNIWVGTQMDGVNILAPNIIHPLIWRYNYLREKNSKEPNPVNAITEDLDGNIWVATADGGVNKMRKGSNMFESFIFEDTNDESISNNSISGLLVDSYNHLWAYTWGVGINELDLNIDGNQTFKRHERENRKGLESDFLGSAAEDRLNNGIWFGSTCGLHFYNRETGRFIRILFDDSDNEFKEVRAMMVDSCNRLWWGTSEGVFIAYLNTLDKEKASIDYIYMKYKLTEPGSRQLEKINCIFQDSKGTIWLGSESNGLYRLKSDENGVFSFANYTTSDGLPGNTVIGIVEDMNGILWMSTGRGLTSLNIKEKCFTNFTREDGLPDNNFNWNSYHYSANDNLLYFGTMNELVAFTPVQIPPGHNSVSPVITSWMVAGGNINPLPDRKMKNDDNRHEVKIHVSDRGLVITFSTLDYANSHRIKYAYRLKGYEEAWIETSPGECMAKYNYLPDGEYVFQLKATDERGHWSNEVTEMSIMVTPYFYKSWWFYILVSVIIVGAVKYMFIVKTEIYRRQKKELELQVAQRTSELENKNKALMEMAQKVEEITEEKMSFFTSITHEFRTPVTLINGPLKIALKLTTQPEVRRQLDIAHRNADSLLKLVNEILDFRKFDADNYVLVKKCTDFISFVDKLLVPFEVFAAERNISIRAFYRMKDRYRFFDEECLRKVIVNLLSNAVKFTPDGGIVNVYIANIREKYKTDIISGDTDDLVYIDVRDTGCGINPDDTERIFKRFYQSPESAGYSETAMGGSGVGLYLCRRIVEMHGGEIYAGNNKVEGAFVRVILPLAKCTEKDCSNKVCSIKNGNSDTATAGSSSADDYSTVRFIPDDYQSDNSVAVGDTADISSSAGNQKTTPETVLVVDDVEDMRTYINTVLSPYYNVLQASNGKEALDILSCNNVDIVISDLMMPVMDGNELSRLIKADISTSHIPLLLLTAIKSEKQQKLSLEIGVDDYLCKPFDEEILLLKVRNILSLRSSIRKKFASGMNFDSLNLNIESKDTAFMKNAMALMKEHYADSEYGVDSFINDMGYSKTLVNSKLHALAGMTIGQFMKEYRLNQAKAYISGNNASVSVSDVAYAVGFNDPKYFTKCFKEMFGILPSELIRKN